MRVPTMLLPRCARCTNADIHHLCRLWRRQCTLISAVAIIKGHIDTMDHTILREQHFVCSREWRMKPHQATHLSTTNEALASQLLALLPRDADKRTGVETMKLRNVRHDTTNSLQWRFETTRSCSGHAHIHIEGIRNRLIEQARRYPLCPNH